MDVIRRRWPAARIEGDKVVSGGLVTKGDAYNPMEDAPQLYVETVNTVFKPGSGGEQRSERAIKEGILDFYRRFGPLGLNRDRKPLPAVDGVIADDNPPTVSLRRAPSQSGQPRFTATFQHQSDEWLDSTWNTWAGHRTTVSNAISLRGLL